MPKNFNSTVALLVGFLKHLGDIVSYSGFSLSQFVLFLQVIPDRLDDDEIRSLCGSDLWLLSDSLCKQKYHWIITVNGKTNVWKCTLIFHTDISY